MTLKYRHLPKRFWVDSDYEEGEERFKKSFLSLKSADFRKIYNKKISPFLRKRGYKTSGFKGLKETQYFHFQVFFGCGKYGGEGVFSLLVHPKGFPTKDDCEFIDPKPPYYHLMCHNFTLPNGKQWICYGRNEKEGQETVQYLLETLVCDLDTVEKRYQEAWEKDVRAMTLDNLKANYKAFCQTYGLRNYWGNYEVATAAHVARFYRLEDHLKHAKIWVEHAHALEMDWVTTQSKSLNPRVKLLLDNIVDPNLPIYWNDANQKVY